MLVVYTRVAIGFGAEFRAAFIHNGYQVGNYKRVHSGTRFFTSYSGTHACEECTPNFEHH